MKTPHPRAILTGLSALVLSLAGASAQQPGVNIPAGNVLYTVGTTFSSAGHSHAYLLWSPTDEDLLRLRAYSIWSKPGGPNSPAQYQPVSWIKVQTDPATIELTLQRAGRLGQDLSKLETAIDGLFEAIRPATGVSRAHKLSTILQGAQNDAGMFHDLLVLSRLHPAVGLCMASAYAGPINGLTTFEIRMAGPNDGPGAPEAARRVVGRITLDPATYQALPAPGPPVSVPFGGWVGDGFVPDYRANLNARMRWGTPDALRQQALLQFGYQVYRINPPFYQSQIRGSALNPGDLAAYAQAFPDEVKRVSRQPVLIDKMFTASQAADRVSDPDTAFLVDSNGMGQPGAVPFQDGQSFYYLITAVDILGRDGHASPATEITIYQTIPPAQPRQVAVEDYVTYAGTPSTVSQRFRINWLASPPTPGVTILRYEVYRWQEVADVSKPTPAHPPLLVASIPAVTGQGSYNATDASLGMPVPASQFGKVHWFTVRAVAVSALADLGPAPGSPKSPHSAPASGVLRDRSTPQPAPDMAASVQILTGSIQMGLTTAPQEDLPDVDYGFLNCRVTLIRDSRAVDGIDCYCRVDDTSATGETVPTPLGPAPHDSIYLGSVRFSADIGQTSLPTSFRIPVPPDNGSHTVTLHLRARDLHGNMDSFRKLDLSVAPATYGKIHLVNGQITHAYSEREAGVAPPLKLHVSRHADTGVINIPRIVLENVSSSWKVLRKIGDGSPELETEGRATMGENFGGKALPANAVEVSYFIQIQSNAGVAGPLQEFARFRTSAAEPPAKPMLLPLEALPNQKATFRWVCTPHGVERFHIGVTGVGHQAAATLSSQLSATFETRAELVNLDGKPTALDFQIYDTGAISDSTPERSVTLDLEDGVTYRFFIQAISPAGERGRVSNSVSFAWSNPEDPGPNAPWPSRPPAQINSSFGDPKASMDGIVIGQLPKSATVSKEGNNWRITPPQDLMKKLYAEKSGAVEGARSYRTLLPSVVFRYQVPNTTFPRVSGDIVQVCPLIKGIAAKTENDSGTDYTVVYDPYFRFDQATKRIYLIPPQPLIDKATYRYLLVLFGDNGEIDSVVPTSTFQVDSNPN